MRSWEFNIQLPPKGKARPRVTRYGHAFMPKEYMQWKQDFAKLLKDAPRGLDGAVSVRTIFTTASGKSRSDVDNAHASVLDALQDAGVIVNDRQVVEGYYRLRKGPVNIQVVIKEVEGEG